MFKSLMCIHIYLSGFSGVGDEGLTAHLGAANCGAPSTTDVAPARQVQSIADRVAHNLEIICKTFPPTRILPMGFFISTT